jgi:hypothetical protein
VESNENATTGCPFSSEQIDMMNHLAPAIFATVMSAARSERETMKDCAT